MILLRTIFLTLLLSAVALARSPEWESPLRASLEKMAATLTAGLKPWPVPDRVFKVADHGAVGDGNTVNTAADAGIVFKITLK